MDPAQLHHLLNDERYKYTMPTERFQVVTNLVQWQVIDTSIKDHIEGGSPTDDHVIAYWQRNQLGDAICETKANELANKLNYGEQMKANQPIGVLDSHFAPHYTETRITL